MFTVDGDLFFSIFLLIRPKILCIAADKFLAEILSDVREINRIRDQTPGAVSFRFMVTWNRTQILKYTWKIS